MNSVHVFLVVSSISFLTSLLFFVYYLPCIPNLIHEVNIATCKLDANLAIYESEHNTDIATVNRIKEKNKELFSKIPENFLEQYKPPCWYIENSNLVCLPYFYIAGFPKCGTTDLWDKITQHPHVIETKFKEYQWWARRFERRGRPPTESMMGGVFYQPSSVEWYISSIGESTFKAISKMKSVDHSIHPAIFGDASMTTGWYLPPSWLSEFEVKGNLVATTADLIHTLTPSAKIIFMLRDPVERLYSGFIFSRRGTLQKSTKLFHKQVYNAVQCMYNCMGKHSQRYCAYHTELCQNSSTSIVDYIQAGMYIIFLRDWLKVFPRDQLHIIVLDYWHEQPTKTLNEVYKFLNLDIVEDNEKILNRTVKNARSSKDQQLGGMLPATRVLLDNFYLPFNNDLMDFLFINGWISK